jgi:Family of unknown function (DUF5677)
VTQPNPNLTLEYFKAKMLEKHEVTLRASMELVKISNGILYEPVAEPLHKVMRAIARVVVNSNGAVVTTATYGYGNDAAKIVRSMFEGAVTIAWLRKKPKLVFDYIDYHKVKLWQQYQTAAAKDPDLAKRLGKERVAEMRMDHDIARPRFLNKKKDLIGSWCRHSIRQRAEDVGLGELYPVFYAQASGMTHLDMSGLLAQAEPNKFDVEVAPSETYVGPSLAMGYKMTFRALSDFNGEAVLKYNDALDAVHKFYIAREKKRQDAEL